MYYSLVFLCGRLRCFADLGVLQRRRCDEPPERASSYLQGSHNCLCERVRATIHTLPDPSHLLDISDVRCARLPSERRAPSADAIHRDHPASWCKTCVGQFSPQQQALHDHISGTPFSWVPTARR